MKISPLVGCLLLLASVAFAAEAPQLAIVAEPSATAAAELLTAELSRQPVKLLERGQIDRVLEEQRLQLAGLATSRLPQLGALLRADGLVFLGTEKVEDREVLTARLVAVHPGVIVNTWQGVAATDELAAWTRATSEAITSLLPKLQVPADAAIPISVLNLRATREWPEAAEIERGLTLLLIHRLAREPAFFVLERQQMDGLTGEHREAPAEFWTGRYLVDGTIEQSTADRELKIRVRLQGPDAAVVAEIEQNCRRAGLQDAADRLVAEIARRLQHGPVVKSWDAKREAEQFWREAQWAFRNQLFAQAATAAETSAALGDSRAEVHSLRVRAELLGARPSLLIPYHDPKYFLTHYLQGRNFHWRAHLPHTRGYNTPDVLAKVYAEMSESERTARLERTRRGLEVYRDHFAELLADPKQTPLAAETLAIGGAMLEWFHNNRASWDDGMLRVAALLRDVNELATRRIGEFRQRKGHTPPPLFWQTKVALTPLWAADAAQTLETYRAALQQPFKEPLAATLRITMLHGRDMFPGLTARSDPALAPKGWADFVSELLETQFPGDRWLGLLFQYEDASKESKKAIATKLRDSLWAERERFAKHELPQEYLDLLRLPQSDDEEAWKPRSAEAAAEPPQRHFGFEFLLYLLGASTPIDRDLFWENFHPDSYPEPQAKALLAAMLAHEKRVRAKIGENWVLETIRERSEELLLRFPQLREEAVQDDALKITRYWTPFRLPQFRDGNYKAADLSFKEVVYRDGRLWVFANFQQKQRKRGESAFIFGVDLKTFEAEVVPFEVPPPLQPARKHFWGGNALEITADSIYVAKDWQLSRYDRKAKTWKHYTEMPGAWEQPWFVGGRLYVRINNSSGGIAGGGFGELVELDPRSDAVTLVASSRRRPAESPMDEWALMWLTARPHPGGTVIFRGISPENSKPRYVTYDRDKKLWETVGEAAWKQTRAAAAAGELEMFGRDSAWTIENRGGEKGLPSLKRGKQRVYFRCELSPEDRAFLANNGTEPSLQIIEQNLMPHHGVAPYGFETPDGIVISQVFRMPGFWLLPKTDLDSAR